VALDHRAHPTCNPAVATSRRGYEDHERVLDWARSDPERRQILPTGHDPLHHVGDHLDPGDDLLVHPAHATQRVPLVDEPAHRTTSASYRPRRPAELPRDAVLAVVNADSA
jgi:hypothetical protein